MLLLFYPFVNGINHYMLQTQGVQPMDPGEYTAIPVALSLFHSTFNILNTFLLIWFVPVIARIVKRLVPSRGIDEFHLEFIGKGIIRTPDISLLEARKEIAKFADITSRMSDFVQTLIHKKKNKKRAKWMNRIQKYEKITDRMEVEIADYLAKVAEGNISEELSVKVRSLLSINNDLERIGDIFYQMSLAIQRKNESNLWFSDKQIQNLNEMFELVDQAFDVMKKNLNSDYSKVKIDKALKMERAINAKRDDLRRKHLKNIEKGHYDVMSGLIYADLFASLEKIGDHIINVSEAVTGKI